MCWGLIQLKTWKKAMNRWKREKEIEYVLQFNDDLLSLMMQLVHGIP